MRFLLAIMLFFAFQLGADTEESADFASSAPPSNAWSKSSDKFVTPIRNEAKVKAIIRDLLGEQRPPASLPPEENSSQNPTVD